MKHKYIIMDCHIDNKGGLFGINSDCSFELSKKITQKDIYNSLLPALLAFVKRYDNDCIISKNSCIGDLPL